MTNPFEPHTARQGCLTEILGTAIVIVALLASDALVKRIRR